PRDFHWVTGVAQLDEIDPLHHAPGGNVEAGNDAFGEAHSSDGWRATGRRHCPPVTRYPLCFLRGRPLIGELLRGGKIELALADRAPGDGAVNAFVLGLAQGLHVVEPGDAAARDYRYRQRLRQRHGGVDVDAGQHAVAADVGVDDRFHAVVLEFLREIEHLVA